MPVVRHARYAPLVLCLFTAPAWAWGTDCKYGADREAHLDTTGADRIEVIARAGDLTLRPGTGSEVAAKGRACASSEAYLAQTQVHAVREGNTVRVFVQVPDQMKGIGIFYATLDLTVDIPAGLPVEVVDTSGDITTQGVRVTKITDSSGDIVARGVPGDIEINDSSGDIRIDDAAGAVTIADSSGDVVIRGARDVLIRSDSSGDLDIARVKGDVRVENDTSGDIVIADVGRNVDVVADTSGDVRVSGVKGTVHVPK
jgi:Toastrack DUF4097